jgi:hypothetical protein
MGKKKISRKGFFVELPEDLLEKWRAFCESYPVGNTTQHVIWAMKRHMEVPPKVTAEQLPEEAGEVPPAPKRGRPKRED